VQLGQHLANQTVLGALVWRFVLGALAHGLTAQD
jgi:hypothetical protein